MFGMVAGLPISKGKQLSNMRHGFVIDERTSLKCSRPKTTRLKHFGWRLETRSLQRLIIGSGGEMRPMSTLAFGGLMPQSILPHVILPHSRLATDVAVRSLRWRLYGRNPCQKDLSISLTASGNFSSWSGRRPEEIVLISRLL